MSGYDSFTKASRHPLAWLSVASLLVFAIIAIVLVYVTPSQAALAPTAPLAPSQTKLEVGMLGPDKAPVMVEGVSEWVNNTIVYTIVITNNTGVVAHNVVITDQWNNTQPFSQWVLYPLPVITDTTFQDYPSNLVESFTQTVIITAEIHETGRAVWELKDLSPGETGMIVFKMTIPSEYRPIYASRVRDAVGPTQVGHSVEIAGTDGAGDPLEAGPLDYVFTLMQGPVLDLVKTYHEVPDVGPRPGWPLTYTIEIYNMTAAEGREDSIPASNITIWDEFPLQLAYDDYCAAQEPGSTCVMANHVVSWELPSDFTLGLGESTFVTFTTRLSPLQDPDKTLKNDKDDLWAQSEQMPLPTHAAEKCAFVTLSIFHKQAETPNPPPDTSRYIQAFPNQTVDYTIWVFNPLSQSLISGMTITDFLPPEWDFITLTSEYRPTVVGNPTDTVEFLDIDLEPSGIVSFSFQAFIGPAAKVQKSLFSTKCGREYFNELYARWPGMSTQAYYRYDWQRSKEKPIPGQINLLPQIELNKYVLRGGTGYPGEYVTYTLEIDNVGLTTVHNVIVSDTFSNPYFRYDHMIDFIEPYTIATSVHFNPPTPYVEVAWEIGTVYPGEHKEFSYVVRIDGGSGRWYNWVGGRSDESTVCWYYREAPVTVNSPINIDKTVSPAFAYGIVQDEQFVYTVNVQNISPIVPYSITEFVDWLNDPSVKEDGLAGAAVDGVYIQYAHVLTPAALLEPSGASFWSHTFTPTLIGDATGDHWCELMDDPTYRQPEQYGASSMRDGRVQISIRDPLLQDFVAHNGSALAPANFFPHVSLEQYLFPYKVSMGKVLTVTLIMTNNMRGVYAKSVHDIDLTYYMPDNAPPFEFLGAVPPYPEPDATEPDLVWNDILLPEGPGTTETFVFRLKAPFDKISRADSVARAIPILETICIPPAGAEKSPLPDYLSVVKGIEVAKEPNNQLVGPREGVLYELKLSNKTSRQLNGVVITDTLPDDFIFDFMDAGPEPEIHGQDLVWTLDFGADGQQNDDYTLIYKAMAAQHVGDYVNMVTGTHPSSYIFYKECDPEDWPGDWPCDKYVEEVIVHVGAGVGLYKTVSPTQVYAGGEVIYTLTMHNLLFGKNLRSIVVSDTLPTGFSYLETLSGPEPEVLGDQTLRWSLSSLGAGSKQDFVFRVGVDESLFEGTYYNRATGTAKDPSGDFILIPDTDDTAPVQVISTIRPVQIDKTVWPDEADAGGVVTYTISLSNDQGQAQTLQLVDTLPSYFGFVGVVGDTPEPDSTSPIAWNALTVPPSSTQVLTFVADIDPLTPAGTYWNHIDAEVEGFQLPGIDTAPVDVEGVLLYDLAIGKDDGLLLAFEGEVFTYTIRYTFTHPVGQNFELLNVVLTETIVPDDFVTGFESANGWEYLDDLGVYSYTLGTIYPHGAGVRTGELSFTVRLSDVIPPEYEQLTNTVEIGHQIIVEAYETDLENNRATDVDILRGSDLVVTGITFDPPVPRVGQVITANVTFMNQGKDDVETRWNGSGAGDDWLFAIEFYLKSLNNWPDDVFDHLAGYCANSLCTITRTNYLGWWPSLNNGETQTWPFTFTVDQEGYYYAYAQVDVTWPEGQSPRPGEEIGWGQPFGLIDEAIESNNIFSYGRINVKEPCVPLTGVGFAWTPEFPTTGEHTLFTASFAPPEASQPITYEWDFGDGYTGGNNPAYHTFLNPGDFNVVLSATNECGAAESSQMVSVTGDPITDPVFDVRLETENGTQLDSKEGPPGDDVRYYLTVYNQSTDMADTFDLNFAYAATWPTTIWPNVVNLLPETSTQVTVTVSIPYEVNLGEQDAIVIEAVSWGDPDADDSVRLTTTADAPQWINPVYLPIVLRGG